MTNTTNFTNVPAILDNGKRGTLTGRTKLGRGFNEFYEIEIDGEGRKWVKNFTALNK